MIIQNEKKVTINQVAEYCGVSKTTISHYLNGKYENMSDETRHKIELAIRKLNFHPDRSAQRLKSCKTMLIGCVIGNVSSPFSALLLKGITSVCEEAGYQVLFSDSQENPRRERRAIQGFLENRVDGLIINTCCSNEEYLLSLRNLGVPIVLADRAFSKPGIFHTVSSSNYSTALDCTHFLFEQGYSHLVFFSETISNITPRLLRRDGFIQGIKQYYGENTEPDIFEFDNESREEVANKINAYINKYPNERIAFLSANGTSTCRLVSSLNLLGIKVGYDLGLCTFDDWDWFEIAEPGITAVAQGTVEIGAVSAGLLLDCIDGNLSKDAPPADIIIPSTLIVRDSTPGSRID